jgi:alkanesulfonate monooxygenase
MPLSGNGATLELITACPPSSDVPGSTYVRRVRSIGRWSEAHGCSATLVYADNRQVDPWMVAQILVQETRSLIPLIAVQPAYMHPFAVATLVASFAHLHGRKVYLNMVAGGFRNDLEALDDPTPHDRRYDRLVEYTRIVLDLAAGESVTFEGSFYRVSSLKLSPPIPKHLLPEIFLSGSSEVGLEAAAQLGARPVSYPKPPGEQAAANMAVGRKPGLRVGIIAREKSKDAWQVAHERFPPSRKGQLLHQLARKASDSRWHQDLSELAEARAAPEDPYWLVPFENYASMCPYLVGSHEEVGDCLGRYLDLGYRTFLLDVPREAADLAHARLAFAAATERAQV